jgi:iron complex outermembrane recepter protein
MHMKRLLSGAALGALAAASAQAQSQNVAGGEQARSEVIVVTGTRTEGRTALETLAPVDVIDAAALSAHGSTELNVALNYSLPSFNFPQPAISDGTDSIRPAQLRGLSPDQTLVLVNNRRRHASALLNLNTVGRGAAAVDLNTIPTAAIGAVEVLRDGAAAQYGSDAIAGVINVRLREAREGGGVTLTYGEHLSSVDLPRSSRNVSDGETLTVGGWTGLPLGADGFVTLSAEYRDRKLTNRADVDIVRQFPLIDGELDPREAQADRLQWRHGNPDATDWTFTVNAGLPLQNGAELYGLATYQDRDATSFGFYRRPQQVNQVVEEFYPFGFLPQINPLVEDLALLGGVRGDAGAWSWDLSAGYGRNVVDFYIRNSVNASLGTASPTEFYAGQLEFAQTTVNADISRQFAVDGLHGPVNLAFGAEYRRENYAIGRGDEASYAQGPLSPPAAPFSQVFPGFSPASEVDEDRDSFGVYADVEADVTDRLTLSGALRYENYSDFGDTLNARAAARFELSDALAVRGSVSTGFRAPSLHQSWFTKVDTVFIDQVPTETGTYAVSSDIARALGATELEPETSTNYSVGAVFAQGGLTVTADVYQIDIDDRILLSENIQASGRPDIAALLPPGVGAARFFLNGADIRTRGLDIVARYSWDGGDFGDFTASAAANFTETELSNIRSTGVLGSLEPPPEIFGRVNILRQEQGAPKDKYIFGVDWDRDNLGAFVRATRFGEVYVPSANPALDFTLSPQWAVDVEGSIQITERLGVALGANNVLDTYPDIDPNFGPTSAPLVFNAFAPAGFNGRYVYGRIRYGW